MGGKVRRELVPTPLLDLLGSPLVVCSRGLCCVDHASAEVLLDREAGHVVKALVWNGWSSLDSVGENEWAHSPLDDSVEIEWPCGLCDACWSPVDDSVEEGWVGSAGDGKKRGFCVRIENREKAAERARVSSPVPQ